MPVPLSRFVRVMTGGHLVTDELVAVRAGKVDTAIGLINAEIAKLAPAGMTDPVLAAASANYLAAKQQALLANGNAAKCVALDTVKANARATAQQAPQSVATSLGWHQQRQTLVTDADAALRDLGGAMSAITDGTTRQPLAARAATLKQRRDNLAGATIVTDVRDRLAAEAGLLGDIAGAEQDAKDAADRLRAAAESARALAQLVATRGGEIDAALIELNSELGKLGTAGLTDPALSQKPADLTSAKQQAMAASDDTARLRGLDAVKPQTRDAIAEVRAALAQHQQRLDRVRAVDAALGKLVTALATIEDVPDKQPLVASETALKLRRDQLRDAATVTALKAALVAEANLAADVAAAEQTAINEAARLKAEKKAKILADWNLFKATPAYVAAQNEIARLKGWDAGAVLAASGFSTDLTAAGSKALDADDFDGAKADFNVLAPKVKQAVADWSLVRKHNVEVGNLTKGNAHLATIPAATAGTPLAAAQAAYTAAWTAVPKPATSTAGSAGLAGLRQTAIDKAEALRVAYEASLGTGAPPNTYYVARRQALLDTGAGGLIQKAGCVPIKNPQMATLLREMDAEYQSSGSGTAKQNYERLASAQTKAKQLIAMRTTGDAAEAAYTAAYRKIETLVTSAAAEPAPTGPGADTHAVTLFQTARGGVTGLVGGTEADRFQRATVLLPDLKAKALAALQPKIQAAKSQAATAAALPSGTPVEKQQKAEAGRAAIAGADPAVLEAMSPDDKITLLATLRTDGMPASSRSNRNDPKRVAMRKVYGAMTLDAQFIDTDNANRKAVVDALMRDHKQEFKDARDNWGIMTKEQRESMLQKVVDAHCAQIGHTKPGGATPGSSFTFYPNSTMGEDTDNGRYSMSRDTILINTKQPVYEDFELAIDLIFHENSHNYQNQLVKGIATITTDPPLTQAKMFQATWTAASNAYINGDEDYDGYQKQPIEAHAWLAGPQAAHMLMDALSA